MIKMAENHKIIVYYDGSCPACVKDRNNYEKLAGKKAFDVQWFDITGKENELLLQGINPHKALTELHVRDSQNQVHIELDAYILLMNKVPVLKPLAWFISLPVVRPIVSNIYRKMVIRRLKKEGRL